MQQQNCNITNTAHKYIMLEILRLAESKGILLKKAHTNNLNAQVMQLLQSIINK
jgi:hypothetical protein